VAVTTIQFELPKAKKLNPLSGFGAQFNTNLFTTDGESTPLSNDERQALLTTIKNLRPGHSRIFVRPAARNPGPERTALMSTIRLASEAGANVNLTWWKGPFPHEPQTDHAQKRKQLMDDFAGIIAEARAIHSASVLYVTIMNEVNSYDIAKAGKPQKSMELYDLLYRDLRDSLRARPDPVDSSKTLAQTTRLVGGDLVEHGPGHVVVNKERVAYGPSNQNDWLQFMRTHMADVLHGYSIHVYWQPNEFPQKPRERLEGLARLGIEKPIYVTEYGVRRLAAKPRPGTFDGTAQGTKMEQSVEAAFMHAWFNALAPQCGCAGLAKWVLYQTTKRGEFGEWGMIGPRRGPLGAFRPTPICDVTRLFNDLIGPQWVADGLMSRPADDRLLASKFKGPRGGQSVVVLNNTAQAQQVQVGGLKENARFFAADWNHDGQGTRRQLTPPLRTDPHGNAVVSVPPKGVVSLSTLSPA
jgi:hypothetical protein